VVAGEGLEAVRSLPHGHVAAVLTQANALGLPDLLGPPGRARDLALALIIARVVHPGSKLATTSWWADTTLGADLGVAAASTDEVYAAMDELLARQLADADAAAAQAGGHQADRRRAHRAPFDPDSHAAHAWRFGRDVTTLFERAGWVVSCHRASEQLDAATRAQHGIHPVER